MRDGPWLTGHSISWPEAAPAELTIDLQNGYCRGHCGHCNKMFLAILNHHVVPMPPTKFDSIWLSIREQMRFEDFQDGHLWGNLRYRARKILATLNLCVALMPPIKFRLNPHCSLGGDVVWRISRWPLWWPSWMLKRNKFSSSEAPCLPNASHQVLA